MSEEADAAELFVRPFIMTGGRAEPMHDGLRLETLVVAGPEASIAGLEFERRRIGRCAPGRRWWPRWRRRPGCRWAWPRC
ncbi:hypothetical protein ACIGW8_22925 [Streptomyces sioyaensis]|uniref:hypothetical protein n=1 Tax=Streptomyces sioyaensis TaxID=67364 RepID=UPI0037D3A2D0